MKRLGDVQDQKGSESDPTPWQLHNDNEAAATAADNDNGVKKGCVASTAQINNLLAVNIVKNILY